MHSACGPGYEARKEQCSSALGVNTTWEKDLLPKHLVNCAHTYHKHNYIGCTSSGAIQVLSRLS